MAALTHEAQHRTPSIILHSDLCLHRIRCSSPFMDSPRQNSDGDSAAIASPSETFRLRGYQAEMVEESMKDNIIVVMDTGSGKTHM